MTEAERQRQAEAWAAQHRELAAEAERQKTAPKREGRVAVRKPGSRGPRKGGGRRAYRLDQDRDRKIVVAALWFWQTRKAQRSFEVLELLDALFTDNDKINIELGDNRLTITNAAGDRRPDRRNHRDTRRNVAPDRRPKAAPNGKAFRKSRLQALRDKIDRYGDAKLTGLEVAFLTHSFVGLGKLSVGDPTGMFALASAGWTLSEAEGKRLASILASG